MAYTAGKSGIIDRIFEHVVGVPERRGGFQSDAVPLKAGAGESPSEGLIRV